MSSTNPARLPLIGGMQASAGGVEGSNGLRAVSGAERAEDLVASAGVVEERQGSDLVERMGAG